MTPVCELCGGPAPDPHDGHQPGCVGTNCDCSLTVCAACCDPCPLKENTALTGDCELDCQERCAYPGQFSECDIGALAATKEITDA